MSRQNCYPYIGYPFHGLVGGPGYCVSDKEGSKFNYILYMLIRTQQIFEWRGLPDTMPATALERLLQINGFAAVAKAPDGQIYAFGGGLGGEPDVYYLPTVFTVANPALNWSAQLKVGSECVIARNDDYFMGLIPMFSRYAELMSENDITMRINDILARMREFISAPDDRSKASADKYVQDIEAGKLGAVGDTPFLDGIKHHTTAGQYRIIDNVEYEQYLRGSWFNEMGINANYNMKREKLNDGEVNMTNTALLPLVDNMLSCRKRAAEEINSMFGLSVGVEFAGLWDTLEKIATEDPEDVAGSAEEPILEEVNTDE